MPSPLDILDADLGARRLDELDLDLGKSAVGPLIDALYAELERAGVDFRPPCYVSNEWGCPDGQPIIGIPFYLVDPRMHPVEEAYADDLETPDQILMGLRHEAGHAVCYAYRLYDDAEWAALFGDFWSDYDDDYEPDPFCDRFVRYLPGWYAQKHPDEDFAECFAVWLDPRSAWRERYAGTPALAKLEYVDRTMARIGRLPPVVDPRSVQLDPDELDFTVAEYYRLRREEDAPPTGSIGRALDADLARICPSAQVGTDAAALLGDRRRAIMRTVSDYTGARMFVVKVLLDFLQGRLRELGIRVAAGREVDAIIGLTALASTLTANYVRTGAFVGDGDDQDAEDPPAESMVEEPARSPEKAATSSAAG